MTTETDIQGEAERWHYHPGQVTLNPLFQWPPKPMAVFKWYAAYWLAITTSTVTIAVAIAIYFLILPPLDSMQALHWSWIGMVYLANAVPHVTVAGFLHLWLYRWKKQGTDFKYDARGQISDNGHFTFRNQVHDNMFWSIASGYTQWTAYQCLLFWAMANGYAPAILFPDNPVWFILMFPFLVIWSSFHFYWVHRALHVPFLYKIAHALHHRNINVGPWSGISMHPVEHVLYFTNFLIHFIVPSHPIHLLFHGYMQGIHPVFSHAGFEIMQVRRGTSAKLGDFFHQLHHKYFECNYGTVEMPWDRWFGTFHDGSAEATSETRARKKRMFG